MLDSFSSFLSFEDGRSSWIRHQCGQWMRYSCSRKGISGYRPGGVAYARIAPRSGLAYQHFIDVGAGVVDSDFRGEIKVILFNHSVEDFLVQAGDRIA